MLDYELMFENVAYNSAFLFAADLEKYPWKNIFEMVKYYFKEHILLSQFKRTPRETFTIRTN